VASRSHPFYFPKNFPKPPITRRLRVSSQPCYVDFDVRHSLSHSRTWRPAAKPSSCSSLSKACYTQVESS
jgi:hypothetical protein